MKNTNKKKLPKAKTQEAPETDTNRQDTADRRIQENSRLFEENIMCYCKRLYSYLYYQCRDEDLSKDMMQETIIEAHEQLKKGTFVEKGLTWFWLQKVAKNRLIGHYRTRSIHNALMQANQNQICDNLGWNRTVQPEDHLVFRNRNGNIWLQDKTDQIKGRICLNLDVLIKSNFKLLHLSDCDRWLIKQHHLQKKTFKELSAIMNKPLSTVMSRYYTVMKKLQRQLVSLEAMGIFDKKLKRKDLYLLERTMETKYKKRIRRRAIE